MPQQMLSDRDQALLFGDETARPGDAVVHLEHGLARFEGYETTQLGDAEQRLAKLVYRHGGKLLLPAREGRDFWQFGATAEAVTLDRLKSDDWLKRRDQMVAELKDSADAVLAEDQKRRAEKARRVDADSAGYDAFAKGFAYAETDDQGRAIAAVLADMAQETPMNRLLIGDVGFGKTEIALRGAAAAVFDGAQVVFAAPTTVLARQHFDDLVERFAGTDVGIAEVTRTTTDAQKRALKEAVRTGDVQIVVGTQSVLGVDWNFADLALVIIDEEQKFGEAQKAQLRGMGQGLHVLTMTATPIPRSLAAAEVGLLGVSVIATAPKDRLPVETRVIAADFDAMMAALATERDRDGQCYVVCPRVADVDDLATRLADNPPDFTYAVAHGQMADDDMEDAMLSFMKGEVDVLLSTSIVESGLDNGRANTMVIWGAERFGLAQLHQLRGRIGRSKLPAHMLLMTTIDLDDAEDDAVKRLGVFAQMSELGAGFRIARKDREMRGFGELDGDAQSGQQSQLGIGLYRHVLRAHLDRTAQ